MDVFAEGKCFYGCCRRANRKRVSVYRCIKWSRRIVWIESRSAPVPSGSRIRELQIKRQTTHDLIRKKETVETISSRPICGAISAFIAVAFGCRTVMSNLNYWGWNFTLAEFDGICWHGAEISVICGRIGLQPLPHHICSKSGLIFLQRSPSFAAEELPANPVRVYMLSSSSCTKWIIHFVAVYPSAF